jgi:signal peptidase II
MMPSQKLGVKALTGGIALCFVLDQITKMWVKSIVGYGEAKVLTPFLSFIHVWNRGISFGLFSCHSAMSRYFLLAIIVGFITVLIMWCRRSQTRWQQIALMLIIGGAIGNAFDRVMFGGVFDFVRLHWKNFYFPAFNLADMLITMGFLALMRDHFQWKA